MLSAGASINAYSKEGKSALDYALEHGHQKVAEILRVAGAEERKYVFNYVKWPAIGSGIALSIYKIVKKSYAMIAKKIAAIQKARAAERKRRRDEEKKQKLRERLSTEKYNYPAASCLINEGKDMSLVVAKHGETHEVHKPSKSLSTIIRKANDAIGLKNQIILQQVLNDLRIFMVQDQGAPEEDALARIQGCLNKAAKVKLITQEEKSQLDELVRKYINRKRAV